MDRMSAKISHRDYTRPVEADVSGMRIGLLRGWMEGTMAAILNGNRKGCKLYQDMGAWIEK